MAKAINWPLAFRDEILAEDCEGLRCAFRLGTLYYENRYWVDGEVVDIRVNHLKVRQGVVQGDLKSCALQDLTPEDLALQKASLRTLPAVMDYLKNTYEKPVEASTLLTVVYYKNLPVLPEEIEE